MSSSKGKGVLKEKEIEYNMEGKPKKKSNQHRELINLEENIRFKNKLDIQRLVLQKIINDSADKIEQ
jgi:hypothetical protein